MNGQVYDFDDLETYNYHYTETGELLSNVAEQIHEIIRRVDSKIQCVVRVNGSAKKSLEFECDAMGNRIAKHVYCVNSFNFTSLEKSTYSVRDPHGEHPKRASMSIRRCFGS